MSRLGLILGAIIVIVIVIIDFFLALIVFGFLLVLAVFTASLDGYSIRKNLKHTENLTKVVQGINSVIDSGTPKEIVLNQATTKVIVDCFMIYPHKLKFSKSSDIYSYLVWFHQYKSSIYICGLNVRSGELSIQEAINNEPRQVTHNVIEHRESMINRYETVVVPLLERLVSEDTHDTKYYYVDKTFIQAMEDCPIPATVSNPDDENKAELHFFYDSVFEDSYECKVRLRDYCLIMRRIK